MTQLSQIFVSDFYSYSLLYQEIKLSAKKGQPLHSLATALSDHMSRQSFQLPEHLSSNERPALSTQWTPALPAFAAPYHLETEHIICLCRVDLSTVSKQSGSEELFLLPCLEFYAFQGWRR